MKSINKNIKTLLPYFAIILFIIIAFIVYFSLVKPKNLHFTIYSYDKVSYIDFKDSSQNITKFEKNSDNESLISFKDESKFIENFILNSKYYNLSLEYDNGYTRYLLSNEGYYYIIDIDSKDKYAKIKDFVLDYNVLCFPFVNDSVIIDDDVFISYDDLNSRFGSKLKTKLFNNYESIKQFYTNVNSAMYTTDDATQTLYVKVYQVRGWISEEKNRLSNDFPIKIKCGDDGVFISVSKTNNND